MADRTHPVKRSREAPRRIFLSDESAKALADATLLINDQGALPRAMTPHDVASIAIGMLLTELQNGATVEMTIVKPH